MSFPIKKIINTELFIGKNIENSEASEEGDKEMDQ